MFDPKTEKIVGLLMSILIPVATGAAAENHVVPIAELRQRIASAGHARQTNLAKTEAFLSLDPVQKALHSARMDGAHIQKAVALLSDDELARFASRAGKVQADLAAGALSNQELTYIVIALGTAVLILVIVAA